MGSPACAPQQSKQVSGEVAEVFYVDFGNRESVAVSSLRSLESLPSLQLSTVPPVASAVELAGVKVPSLDDEFGVEAAQLLSQITIGLKLQCRVVMREQAVDKKGERVLVSLAAAEGPSVAASLCEAGVARTVRPRSRAVGLVVDALLPFQQQARKDRLNLWQYGDVDSDDDM